jgi:phosphoglycerate dehydrogenase-like enzyme
MALWKSRVRAALIATCAALTLGGTPANAQNPGSRDCDAVCRAGAELIERFELRESATPVRERPGWAPPTRIAVADVAAADFLRKIAPDAEIVGVPGLRNFSAMVDAVEGADVLIGLCSPEIVERGKDLRWIQLLNAGAETCTSVPEVAERGILVTNLQRIQGPHMAEHAIAMMLALARGLAHFSPQQHAGAWTLGLRELGDLQLLEVEQKTLLVVGLGGIGTEVAKRAAGLGMRVQATRNTRREGPAYVEYVGLPHELLELAANADVVVNSTPLTAETRGMFDAEFFRAMKETAYFINIGRGESVVTDDLVAALRTGAIAGAGLDVTDPEPLPPGHPLWSMTNVILTPHIATSSDFRDQRTVTLVAENLRRYLRGDRMLSVVDLEQGY